MSPNSKLYRVTRTGELHNLCREERARLIEEDEQLRRQEDISRHLRWLQEQQKKMLQKGERQNLSEQRDYGQN